MCNSFHIIKIGALVILTSISRHARCGPIKCVQSFNVLELFLRGYYLYYESRNHRLGSQTIIIELHNNVTLLHRCLPIYIHNIMKNDLLP